MSRREPMPMPKPGERPKTPRRARTGSPQPKRPAKPSRGRGAAAARGRQEAFSGKTRLRQLLLQRCSINSASGTPGSPEPISPGRRRLDALRSAGHQRRIPLPNRRLGRVAETALDGNQLDRRRRIRLLAACRPTAADCLPALYLWRRLAVEGLGRFGDVYYYGTAPLVGHEGLVDVLVGSHKGVDCRFYFDPAEGHLLAMEMFRRRGSGSLRGLLLRLPRVRRPLCPADGSPLRRRALRRVQDRRIQDRPSGRIVN